MLKKSLSILLTLIICFSAVMVTPFTALSKNASENVGETFSDEGVMTDNSSKPESELKNNDDNKSELSVSALVGEEFSNKKSNLAASGAETYGDFKYTVSGTNATITGYTGSGGAITIPAKTNGYTVSGIGTGAFRGNKVITKLTIEFLCRNNI